LNYNRNFHKFRVYEYLAHLETPEGGYTVKRRLKIFAGKSNQGLAKDICKCLSINLGKMTYVKFSNCNIKVTINESVREDDVFVIQSGYPDTNEALMEFLIIIDALKYASASRITAVIPYYPYVRSDKKDEPRISITARLVADLLETAGANRILAMDLHSPQIGGFSHIPVDQLQIIPTMCDYISKKGLENFVVAAPDVGSAKRAEGFARRLDVPMVIMDKRRYRDDEKAEVTNIIGDVRGMNCFILDDEVSTGGSMIEACRVLKEAGANDLFAGCSHGILCGDAQERLQNSPLKEFITTNTIDQSNFTDFDKLKTLNVANLFSEAIAAIHMGTSVSKLFI
jgi:ribose-phosphate pyrophosphokinase